MKKSLLTSFLAALLLACAGCNSTTSSTPQGKVVVNFDHPEKFADVQSSYTKGVEQGYLDDISRYLAMKAGPYIAVGQTLTVTFTDIDMAGQVGLNTRAPDVRINRGNSPVRLNFSYAVTDAAGKVVKEGKEELVNNFPGTQMGTNQNDVLFHEKEELETWIRAKLR